MKLTDEVARLDALERSHFDAIARRERLIKDTTRHIARGQADIDQLAPMVEQIAARSTGSLAVTIGDQHFTERKDAALPFANACRRAWEQLRDRPHWETRPVATIHGLQLLARRENVAGTVNLSFDTPRRRSRSPPPICSRPASPPSAAPTPKPGAAAARREHLQRYPRAPRSADRPPGGDHRRTRRPHQQRCRRVRTPRRTQRKRALLDELTAVLRLESESAAAKAAAAEVAERMRVAGRQPGWSLDLNPTPALCEEAGYDSPDAYRYAYNLKTRHRAKAYRDECRDRDANRDHDRGEGAAASRSKP